MFLFLTLALITVSSSQTTVWSNREDSIESLSISITNTSSGLQVDVYTSPYEYSGEGYLIIRNKTYKLVYQQNIDIMWGGTTVVIPYNLFVIDNGNYTVEVDVDVPVGSLPVSDTDRIELMGVVEEIATVDAHAILDEMQPKIYIGVLTSPSVPFAASCNVTITKLDTCTEIYTNEPLSYNNTTQMFSGSLPYSQSGGYKIKVQVVNNLKIQTTVEKIINNTIINLVPIITEYPPQKITIYNTRLSNGTQISGTQANESNGWARFVHSDLADEKSYEITYNVKDYDDELSNLIVTWDVGYNKSQGQSVNNPSSENGTNDTIGGVGVFDAWYQYPIKNCSYKVNLGISDRHSQAIATCEVTVVAEYTPTKVVLSASTEISKNSTKLTWTQNNDTDFANYTIYQSTTSSIFGFLTNIITITDRAQTSFTVTNLTPNTTYYFIVRVYNTEGYYSDSNQVSGRTFSEEEIKTSPTKPSEIPWLYIIISVIVVTSIITVIALLRIRKPEIPQIEKPKEKGKLDIEFSSRVKTMTLRCPDCKTTFSVEVKPKPFRIKCPSCGTEGVIR